MKIITGINFDEEVLRAIDKEAKLSGRSRSNYINIIMRNVLNVPVEKKQPEARLFS